MIKTITALTVLTLIATVGMNNAYAIEGDGTSHVEVDEYPFNITILEGGSMTLHNNGEQTIDFVSHGWFEGTVPANDAIALEFPVVNCGITCFVEGMYYISDLNGGYQSTIEIVKPVPVYVEPVYVAPVVVEPTPEPVYVVPVVVEPVVQELVAEVVEPVYVDVANLPLWEEPIIVEPTPEVNFGATSSETLGSFESISDEGIFNVPDYDGEVDMITMQTQLAEVTAKFNDSITKLADQKVAIENHDTTVQSLNTQIGSLNATSTEVSTLEQTVLSLQLEKDELNAQITTLGNTTATQLATITSLQGDADDFSTGYTMLDVKIVELESQIVSLTNANVTATTTIAELNDNVISAGDTSVLDSKIANLEAQVVTLTGERDQWKQLANNWYAVAMDQLKVMVDILGL